MRAVAHRRTIRDTSLKTSQVFSHIQLRANFIGNTHLDDIRPANNARAILGHNNGQVVSIDRTSPPARIKFEDVPKSIQIS